MARLFISHSSANNGAAFALRDWLAEQGFDDVFLDVDPGRGLVAGERWQEALKAAADRCEAILFLVSAAWLDSKWCLAEFLLAKTLHKRIVGLIVEPVPIDRVPVEMTAEWQLCDLTGTDRVRGFEVAAGALRERVCFSEAGLGLLRRGLERAGLDARSFPWPPAREPERAPYRGLRVLEPEDAAIFFGRDAMIVRGLDRLRGLVEDGVEPLMVVLGASGSGKSSFLRAGLLPRLARDDSMFLPLPVIRPETAALTGGAPAWCWALRPAPASGLARRERPAASRRSSPRAPKRSAACSGSSRNWRGAASSMSGRRFAGPAVVGSPIRPSRRAVQFRRRRGGGPVAGAARGRARATGGRMATPRVIVLVTMRSDRYEKQVLQAQPVSPASSASCSTCRRSRRASTRASSKVPPAACGRSGRPAGD